MPTAVPSNIIIPFVGVSFDNSLSGAASTDVPVKLLLIGQRTSSGSVAAEIVYLATNANDVGAKSGFGSQLHRMALFAMANNKTVPVYCVGLDDAATSTAATSVWTLSGTATASGEYVTYVGGQRYAIGVSIGDTAADIQIALTTALTADVNNLPVTAADDASGEMTLTAKNKGIAAGDLDVRFNANHGEQLPAGLSLTSVTFTAGTVDPDIADALAVLGSDWFNVIAQPYTDNTNMNLIEAYLDSVNDPLEMRDAMCYQALRDTLANTITYGSDTTNRNSEWMATLAVYKRMQSTFEIAAEVAGLTAVSIQDDPAVPLHRMNLTKTTALDTNDRWTAIERNLLALSGIATLSDDVGVQTEATVTMYLKNDAGADDTSYKQQNTMFKLSSLRYRFVNWMLSRYSRAKLASNADLIGPGQQIMTLDTARDEAVAWFKQAQRDGLVEPSQAALTQFKADLKVERDSGNENRINWLLPPDLMNLFIVGSGVIQFRQ